MRTGTSSIPAAKDSGIPSRYATRLPLYKKSETYIVSAEKITQENKHRIDHKVGQNNQGKSNSGKNSGENPTVQKREVTAWDYNNNDMIYVDEDSTTQSKGNCKVNNHSDTEGTWRRTVSTVQIKKEKVDKATERWQEDNESGSEIDDTHDGATLESMSDDSTTAKESLKVPLVNKGSRHKEGSSTNQDIGVNDDQYTSKCIDRMECNSGSKTSSEVDGPSEEEMEEDCMSSTSQDSDGNEVDGVIANSHAPKLQYKTLAMKKNSIASQENKKQKISHLISKIGETNLLQNVDGNSTVKDSSRVKEFRGQKYYQTTDKDQASKGHSLYDTSLLKAKMNGRDAPNNQSESDREWEQIAHINRSKRNRG